MQSFDDQVLAQAGEQREVEFTTFGRRSGDAHRKILWLASDGRRLFIRSGQGLVRDWPQNLLAGGTGILHLAGRDVPVRGRLISDPSEAREVSRRYREKYGDSIKASADDEPLTPGEQSSFELIPA
jgi:Uncharacterized protein conserved in bacteria (DUF2255)